MFCFLKNLTTTKILNFEFYTLFGTVSKVSNFPIPQTSDNQAKKDIIQKDPDKMSGSSVRGTSLFGMVRGGPRRFCHHLFLPFLDTSGKKHSHFTHFPQLSYNPSQ